MEGFVSNTTKHDLIADVSKFTGLTQADTKIVVEELLESISTILESGKSIEIRGFGTFYTKTRKPRPARNPKTGEVVPLLKRMVPLFKYSNELKKKITDTLLQKTPVQT
jgi:integration host factor subunit beta